MQDHFLSAAVDMKNIASKRATSPVLNHPSLSMTSAVISGAR